MELLKYDSKDEENSLLTLIVENTNMPIEYYHIGGFNVGNKWKWKSDLSDVIPNIKWIPGEPNSNAAFVENCLSIWKQDNLIGLNDIRCKSHPARFICQKPKILAPNLKSLQLELETQKAIALELKQQVANLKSLLLDC